MKNNGTGQIQKTSLQAIVKILIILLLLSFSACSTPVTPLVIEPEPENSSGTTLGASEDSPLMAILNKEGRQPALSPAPDTKIALEKPEQLPESEATPTLEPAIVEERPINLNALETRQKTYTLTASYLDRTTLIGVISLPKSIETAITGESKTFSVATSNEAASSGSGKAGNINPLKPSAAHSYIEPVSIIKVNHPESFKSIFPDYSANLNTPPSLVRFNFPSGFGVWIALAIAIVISGTTAVIFIPKRKKKSHQ